MKSQRSPPPPPTQKKEDKITPRDLGSRSTPRSGKDFGKCSRPWLLGLGRYTSNHGFGGGGGREGSVYRKQETLGNIKD